MLCLFLAILELVKRQAVTLRQQDAFGEIALKRGAGFAEAFSTEQIQAAEKEYI